MKKSSSIVSILLAAIMLLALGCDFSNSAMEDINNVRPATDSAEAVSRVTYIPSNFGVYTINSSGTYVIKGTVTGKYIDVKSGNVIIEGEAGTNPTFKGQGYGETRSSSHIRGGGSALTVRNFKFIGHVKHNVMRLNSNNTLVDNMVVINDTKEGAGAINPGHNSMVRNSHIQPHDDAIKLTEPNSKAKNCDVIMDGNGSAIQFGWQSRANGAVHHADDIRISGYLRRNKQTNTDNNPGRAVIGGIFENNTSDIKLTNLDINMDELHDGFYIKLRAQSGATLKNVLIQGIIRNPVSVHSAISPVALSTGGGGKIQNITIDLGPRLTMADVYKDAGVTGFTLITDGGADDDDDDDDNDDNNDDNDDNNDDDNGHPANAVRLWADPDYKGIKALFTVGDYNQSAMVAAGMNNNDAHSIKVLPGYEATVFTGSNFEGQSKKFTTDAPRLGGKFSNQISSIRVRYIGN